MIIKKTIIAFLLLIMICIAACSSNNIATPKENTLFTEGVSPDLTILATSSLTPNINNGKPTLYPGQIATMASRATQTKRAMNDNCDGFPSSYYELMNSELLISPDGNWGVDYCVDQKKQLPYTKLTNMDNQQEWRIPFYETFGSKHNVTDGVLEATHWSENGKYLYLDAFFCCVDGPGMMFVDSYGYYQVNLQTGDVKEILPTSSAFAFSPDGKYLVSNDYSENVVHIYNLENNEDVLFPIDAKYAQVGLFLWSPNGKRVVFVGALPEWVDTWLANFETTITPTPDVVQDGFSLLVLDLNNKTVVTLIDNDSRFFTPSEWVNDEEILVFDKTNISYKFNITAKQMFVISTQTVTP